MAKVCQMFMGVQNGGCGSTSLDVEFDTPACNVSLTDVTLDPPSEVNTRACTGSCPIP